MEQTRKRPGEATRGVNSTSQSSNATTYGTKTGRALVPRAAITAIRTVAVTPVALLAVRLDPPGIDVTAHPGELLDQRAFRRLAKAQGVALPRVARVIWRARVRHAVRRGRVC